MQTSPEPDRPRRPWWVRALRLLAVLTGICLVVVGIGAAVLGWLYRQHVLIDPGPHLERDHIMSIIAQESPVYYRDGTTRIGVFFEDEHRQYVPWEEMPPPYVAAIVAAEDGTYWSHRGVSPKHIVRALRDNAVAGRTVSGGSTLTQQTAKNIYYRPDRSWKAKGTELVNALRLEAHYDKSEILTFYANQFHVSGNGRGLGIASRYFFDEPVSDLRSRTEDEAPGEDLVKAAFLAGLVKGPGRYDPFLGDPERQARSRERAMDRTRYVLRRIAEEPEENLVGPWPVPGVRSEAEAQQARLRQVRGWKVEAKRLLDEGFELPFSRGRFRYDSSAVLDEVRERLAEPPFDQVLQAAGIDDPSRAGLKVITTLDPAAQREATYGLWHHLTEVGTWMETLDAKDFIREDSRGPRHDPYHEPREHEFRLARVLAHPVVDDRLVIDLDLGGGHRCRVDRDGLIRVAVASERARVGNRYAKLAGAKVDAFGKALSVGSVVWVSVRQVGEGGAVCDLEVRPELQGSVVVLEDGQMRAMVGGNDNRNFNRATALRQFGSTWKPLIYHASMELGWRPDDPLDNRRNVFPFSTTFYYPRPDHTPEPVVSMAWAGVNSENLASIWLLYHLTDKLETERVRTLAQALDLAQREGESDTDYRRRIQEAGVLPTRSRIDEALFLQARHDVLGGLGLSDHPEDELSLSSLLYGWGHRRELGRVRARGGRERARKERALANSYVHLSALAERCQEQHRILVQAVEQERAPDPERVPDLSVLVGEDGMDVACGDLPEGYVRPDAEGLGLAVRLDDMLDPDGLGGTGSLPSERPVRVDERDPGDGGDGVQEKERGGKKGLVGKLGDMLGLSSKAEPEPEPRERVAAWADVLLDDRLHVGTLQQVDRAMERRRALLETRDEIDLYDPELLYWHQDFRVLLALRYVSELAGQYGVRSDIRPVLSLPLGASEITLEEATSVYGGLVSGKAWSFPGQAQAPGAVLSGERVDSPADPALLIAEIRDVDDRVIYRAEPEPREVAGDETGAMTADILRNVVLHGTGRRAKHRIEVAGAPAPAMGKTGTTNDFKNAAFLGAVPRWTDQGWSASDALVIGAYVGYDDNRPMRNQRIILAGASGALPPWISTAEGLARAGLLGEPDQQAPDEGWTLAEPSGLVRLPVDAEQGLPLEDPELVASPDPEGEDVVGVDQVEPDQAAEHAILTPPQAARPVHDVRFEEVPRPVRIAPSTTEAAERARRRQEMLDALRDRGSIWEEL